MNEEIVRLNWTRVRYSFVVKLSNYRRVRSASSSIHLRRRLPIIRRAKKQIIRSSKILEATKIGMRAKWVVVVVL